MRLGISIGALVSIIVCLIYIVVLHERGSAFYLFAALAFAGGPLLAGIVAVIKTQESKFRAFVVSSGGVFGIVFTLFVVNYVVLPQFDRTNVQLPAFCDGLEGEFNPPSHLTYTLPDAGQGMVLASDEQSTVVVTIDYSQSSFPSTIFLVKKDDKKILQSMRFNNDVVSAALDEGTVYIYNDKLGYLIDARTGEFEEDFLLIDNYGGLTQTDRPFISRASDGHWYMETTAVLSSWNIDGTVKSRPHLTFNSIARGCFINGDTDEVTRL